MIDERPLVWTLLPGTIRFASAECEALEYKKARPIRWSNVLYKVRRDQPFGVLLSASSRQALG